MAHGCTEMLAGVPKCEKAVMCLLEKMPTLNKLHSGMSYSAVGRVFNVNELTVDIQSGVFKHKHTKDDVMY